MKSLVHTGEMVTQVAGEEICLLPHRAAFWPARDTLLLADLHFGKDAAFRSAGIPLPRGGTTASLDRLSILIRTVAAKRLLVLGDFFHSEKGRDRDTLSLLSSWRNTAGRVTAS